MSETHPKAPSRHRRRVPALIALALAAMVIAPAWAVSVSAPAADAAPTKTSARHLLSSLPLRAESHGDAYSRDLFRLWIDADRDGENTRAEVLRAESSKAVTENAGGTVLRGRWRSAYDGKVVTRAAKLDIDHLVPLEEAWVSGAAAWSATKREAYANDLGYGPSLIAVSLHENRSKGDDEPGQYLPPKRSYRCTYVRNWIAVKVRWHLSVDRAERTTLSRDLASFCRSTAVEKPAKPSIRSLVGAGAHSTATATPGPSAVASMPPDAPVPVATMPTASTPPLYANCAEAGHPISYGQPGYSRDLDGDGDGVACEDGDPSSVPVAVVPPTPTPSPTAASPAGATAICRDGTVSYSATRSGTCSGHGGVRTWL